MSWPATLGLGLVLAVMTAVGFVHIWLWMYGWRHDLNGSSLFLVKGCVDLVPVVLAGPVLFGKHLGNVPFVLAAVAIVGGNVLLGRIARRDLARRTNATAFEAGGGPEH